MADQRATWVGDHDLVVDGVTFRANLLEAPFTSTPERFCLWKRPGLVRRYLRLLDRHQPRSIFELGVFKGGSAALMALVARPDKLVAVELDDARVEALDTLAADRGLNVSVHYGVDQADTTTLARIAAEQLDRPLDLVVDDASHSFEPTEASFNVLFPRIRPGGKYIIEDWGWGHAQIRADGPHDETQTTFRPHDEPLTTFVFEAIMAIPQAQGIIADVRVDPHYAVITRGKGEAEGFDIRDAYDERGRNLVVSLSSESTTSTSSGSG